MTIPYYSSFLWYTFSAYSCGVESVQTSLDEHWDIPKEAQVELSSMGLQDSWPKCWGPWRRTPERAMRKMDDFYMKQSFGRPFPTPTGGAAVERPHGALIQPWERGRLQTP